MTAEGPVQGWADPVAAFLRAHIPREDETPARESRMGWNHMFSTAFQVGCKALIALGEATEEPWGARPVTPPVRPKELPRWDDIAVAVLWLADQQNKIGWRQPDGNLPPRRVGQWTIVSPTAPPAPNIAAANGGRPAFASAEVVEVLSALGLIADGAWTASAELVLWRCGKQAGGPDFRTDPRFAAAVQTCLSTVPPDIHDQLSDLTRITATEFADARARWTAQLADHVQRYPHSPALAPPTEEGLLRSLAFRRRNDADWLFFRRWRLPDGWLSPSEAARALAIFQDPLAIAMRRAVIAGLFPDSDLARAEPPLGAG